MIFLVFLYTLVQCLMYKDRNIFRSYKDLTVWIKNDSIPVQFFLWGEIEFRVSPTWNFLRHLLRRDQRKREVRKVWEGGYRSIFNQTYIRRSFVPSSLSINCSSFFHSTCFLLLLRWEYFYRFSDEKHEKCKSIFLWTTIMMTTRR